MTFRHVYGYLLNLKVSSWDPEHYSCFLSGHHRALPAQGRATGRCLLIDSMGQLPKLTGISHHISLGESLTLTVGSHCGASLSKNLKTYPLVMLPRLLQACLPSLPPHRHSCPESHGNPPPPCPSIPFLGGLRVQSTSPPCLHISLQEREPQITPNINVA